MWLEVGLPIAIPSITAAGFIIRYFWKKEKCFIILENTVNKLSTHDNSSNETHDGFEDRLNIIERNQIQNEIYLKLILNKLEIPYK